MTMTLDQIKELALHSVKGTAPATFSVENVNEALKDALHELGGSMNQFMKNRYDIYQIYIDVADEIVPKKVMDAVSRFAEVKTVANGEKVIFKTRLGKDRARRFVTRVGLAGVYETFRLDVDYFEINTSAIGGGCSIDFTRWVDGAEDLAEMLALLNEALVDAVYGEVQRALRAAAANMPKNNVVIEANFNADAMFKLIGVVRAYGNPIIFAPPEFVGAMGADAIVPVATAGSQAVYHSDDIDSIHNTGYITIFRGTPVVQIPQSFTDRNNDTTYIDPQTAYVLPAGNEKVVKVVFEGPTQVDDFKNRDRSMEVDVYKKVGVGIITHHNWAIYVNEGIAQTMDEDYMEL